MKRLINHGAKLALTLSVGLMLGGSLVAAQASDFTLTVLHTNDTHANYDADGDGNGGVAGLATLVDEARAERANVILLDAGDRFTGSIFHTFYLGQDNVRVMNALGYDAMTLGSYEFTHGPQILADFISGLDFPVLGANIDVSNSAELADLVLPATIIERDGQQIGVVGLTRGDARVRPLPDVAYSTDYAAIAQVQIDALREAGVNKIILLSHVGYFNDLELAALLSGVDIIIGGDSETLLSNTNAEAEGPYPAALINADGDPVVVAQAASRYQVLGQLEATFDADGVLTAWEGEALPITAEVTPNAEMVTLIDELRGPITDFLDDVVGQTEVRLVGEREVCRFEECNLGNLITDAMRATTGTQIAIMNGGGIRASIEEGDITVGQTFDVLPFSNTYVSVELEGADIIAMLENSVSRVDQSEGTGRFLQVSGLRYEWDGSQPAGRRIVNVEVMTEDGDFEPLDPSDEYSITLNDYLLAGGDDYTMFAENGRNPTDFGRALDEMLRNYVEVNSPIALETENRIVRVDR